MLLGELPPRRPPGAQENCRFIRRATALHEKSPCRRGRMAGAWDQRMPLDAAQLAELIDRQAESLRLWIGLRCAAADDVVQEAFCRLAIQSPPPENPVAWLYQVCRNLADKQRRSDSRRSRRENARALEETNSAVPADPLELAEAVKAVELLDDELREVLVARIWGGLSLEQIARMCAISTATAHRRYHAALHALRMKLEHPCEDKS